MLLLQLLRACVRARGCLRDRHHVSADLHVGADPASQAWRIEFSRVKIFEIIGGGQTGELGGQPPELALLTAPNNLEYLYTKIRFSTPALSAL
jgi:hypothetical protein